jgi:hypothetical protein
MARAYYGTKISPNQTRTPEGYLICHNVPIARTGWQEYLGSEIGLDSSSPIQVYRSEEEVFHPATIASFEGKTVADAHPSEWISPNNEGAYHKGHVQNVRRGTGEESEFLLADLFVKDANLINKVDNGLREVSCGYDCLYEPMEEGQYAQKQIRGNHVAVVAAGRAGDRVAIRDAAPEKRSYKMISLRTILGLGLKEYAKDAEPEKVAEAFEMTQKSGEESGKDGMPTEGGGGEGGQIAAMLQQILSTLQQLVQSDKQVHSQVEPPKDALDELVAELETKEEHQAEQAAGVEDAEVVPVETLSGGELPKNPIPGADSKAATLAAIRAIKPVIAMIKDDAERKKATDALVAEFRKTVPPGNQKGGYGALLKLKKAEDQKTQDRATADAEYGKQLREKFHRKPMKRG